jgi:indoleamine 2,3-dioxygenase
MGVELAGAPLLPIVAAADRASRDASDGELARELEAYANGMDAVLQALHRIREWCNPATYYLRVRPYVTGWPAPGAVYEGVSEEPKKYLGGSAAQSSLLQVFDALLGLAHPTSLPASTCGRSGTTCPLHRAFVEDIERSSRVRDRAIAGALLRDASTTRRSRRWSGSVTRHAAARLHHSPVRENSAHEGTGGPRSTPSYAVPREPRPPPSYERPAAG